MKLIASFSLILTLSACGLKPEPGRLATETTRPIREFTGHDAQKLVDIFKNLGMRPAEDPSGQRYGFNLTKIECTQVPSPRALPLCVLTQGGLVKDAGGDSGTIYGLFVENGAKIYGERGVTKLVLTDVDCLTYNVYRGTSKCFYRQ
ncbi:MAG: hypothetical protein HQK54_17525 [Oligoflexales bacterium]|nr:hypothetical protein [Oligoflexales bacterium]